MRGRLGACAILAAAAVVAFLAWRVAGRDAPARAASRATEEAPPRGVSAGETRDGSGAQGPAERPDGTAGPLDLVFRLDAGRTSALVRVAVAPAEGAVRVSVAPADDHDFDIMVRSGAPGPGTMESFFRLGGHAFAAEVEWDRSMRLASLRIRGGRAQGDGARPLEHFAADGAPLPSGRDPDAAYVLERVRDGDLDVRCELRRRDGS